MYSISNKKRRQLRMGSPFLCFNLGFTFNNVKPLKKLKSFPKAIRDWFQQPIGYRKMILNNKKILKKKQFTI
jgi:hypothetical protein